MVYSRKQISIHVHDQLVRINQPASLETIVCSPLAGLILISASFVDPGVSLPSRNRHSLYKCPSGLTTMRSGQ